jgi:hypothetical protein
MAGQEFIDALLTFRSREADPRLRPDPYHLRRLAEQVRSAFSAPHLDQGFAGRLRGPDYRRTGSCRGEGRADLRGRRDAPVQVRGPGQPLTTDGALVTRGVRR